jgi:peptidyl-prolyl cis-trans isomerase B (cyclophilin B)
MFNSCYNEEDIRMKINKTMKRSIFPMMLLIIFTLTGCGKTPAAETKQNSTPPSTAQKPANTPDPNYKSQYSGKKPVVTIEMEDGSKIKAELYPDIAPKTVDNFVSLIQKNFYDGLIFHRVIPGFMIQGGDPNGVGTGGPGYNIAGEFTNNGFKNDLKHTRGVLSMARSKTPNSAGSQFFIMVKDNPSLDKDYASFGKVTEGMETVDKIVNVKRDQNDKPEVPQKMKKVTVEIK